MTVYTFNKVALTGKKRVKCSSCGKMLTRQKEFYQTLNPFNKNVDGFPKSGAEIIKELQAEIHDWETKPGKCADEDKCEANFVASKFRKEVLN